MSNTSLRAKIVHFKKLRRRVRDRERRFQQMSSKRQRIIIARDVIEALEKDLIRPLRGTYLFSKRLQQLGDTLQYRKDRSDTLRIGMDHTQYVQRYRGYENDEGKKAAKKIDRFQQQLRENNELISELSSLQLQSAFVEDKCTACAVGSMFRCLVLRKDALNLKTWTTKSSGPWNARYQGNRDMMTSYMSSCFSRAQINLIEEAFEEGAIEVFPANHPKGHAAIYFGKQYSSARERLIAIMENVIENDGEFNPPAPPQDWRPPLRRGLAGCYY